MFKFSLNLKAKCFIILPWKGYKVAFFGSDEFSKVVLHRLNADLKFSHQCEKVVDELAVITTSSTQNPVYDYGKNHSLTLLNYPNVPENFDIGVVASFGKLISQETINSFSKGIINVHPSLLPQLRGASPIASAILNSMSETGVSIMDIKADKFDQGDILAQTEPIKIPPIITCPMLTQLLAEHGSHLLIETLKAIDYRKSKAVPQSEFGSATYSKKFSSEHVHFETNETAATEILKHVCAHGHLKKTGVYIQVECFELRLYEVCLPPLTDMLNLSRDGVPNPCGMEFSIGTKTLYVNTMTVPLGIKSLALKGKKPMSAYDFFNGYVQDEDNLAVEKKLIRFRNPVLNK